MEKSGPSRTGLQGHSVLSPDACRCMPKHDTRLGGFQDKQLLRAAMHCLHELTAVLPVLLWSEAWKEVSFCFAGPFCCLLGGM